MNLSDLAAQYRSSEEGSELHNLTLTEYYKTFDTLAAISREFIALDQHAELPDRRMPKAYVDYWLNVRETNDVTDRINTFITWQR